MLQTENYDDESFFEEGFKSNRSGRRLKKLQTANIDTDINSKLISKVCAPLLEAPWTIAHQAPLFIKFSKQDYWSGLLFPPPGHLPIPGIKPRLLCPLNWQENSLPLAPPGKLHGRQTGMKGELFQKNPLKVLKEESVII